jgi:hypothetical protein
VKKCTKFVFLVNFSRADITLKEPPEMLFLCYISLSGKSYLNSEVRCNFRLHDIPEMCRVPEEKYSLGLL